MTSMSMMMKTRLIAVIFILVMGFIVWMFFSKPIGDVHRKLDQSLRRLSEDRTIILKKPELKKRWDENKDKIIRDGGGDAASSAWVNRMLSLAQEQNLNLESLEPAGARPGDAGKTIAAFVSFRGDMTQLVKFIYALSDKDVLARVESVSARQDEGGSEFSFEIVLARPIG